MPMRMMRRPGGGSLAAEQGLAEAQFIGIMYDEGRGVPQDDPRPFGGIGSRLTRGSSG